MRDQPRVSLDVFAFRCMQASTIYNRISTEGVTIAHRQRSHGRTPCTRRPPQKGKKGGRGRKKRTCTVTAGSQPSAHSTVRQSCEANLLGLIEREGVAALSASVTIVVDGHEGGGTAHSALTSQTGDLVVLIDLKTRTHTQQPIQSAISARQACGRLAVCAGEIADPSSVEMRREAQCGARLSKCAECGVITL